MSTRVEKSLRIGAPIVGATGTPILSVDSDGKLAQDAGLQTSGGDITKINNVDMTWPDAQGDANTILTNDGEGGFYWQDPFEDTVLGVKVATYSALPTCTYDNGVQGVGATLTKSTSGALPSIDGKVMLIDDRILVTTQASA